MHRVRLGIIAVAIALAAAWLYSVVSDRARIEMPSAHAQRSAPPPPPTPAAPLPSTPTPAPVAAASVGDSADAAPSDDEPPAAERAESAPSGPPPVDADHAADLFADLLARQDGDPPPDAAEDPARALWHRFDEEKTDADWADETAADLRETLAAWLANIPEQSGSHLALVHVECRSSLCQVLAADNDEASQSENVSDGAEWQQAIARLRDAPWWSEAGFGEVTTQVTTVDGYVLYTTYLARAAGPTAQTPADAASG